MGGGSLFLNGEEILTLDSYLDKVYPKETEFVFPSGFHPGEKIGGDWTCVAEDIVMPLGNSAPVSNNGGITFTDSYGVTLYLRTPSSTIGKQATGNAALYNSATNTGAAQNSDLKYKNGLQVNLSQTANAKLVSIWKRVE